MISQIVVTNDQTQLHPHILHILNQATSTPYTHLKSPDILHINTENETIKIEQIRKLNAELYIRPTNIPIKIAILYHAHQLTLPAQNALLKLLEEPPNYVQIILATSQPQTLLPTIKSRCLTTKLQNTNSDSGIEINLTDLLKAKPITRLQHTTQFKTRDQALSFIDHLIRQAHTTIKTQPNSIPAQTLKHLLDTQRNLNANSHVQLTLDQCFLHLT